MPLGASRLSFLAKTAEAAAPARTAKTLTAFGNAQVDTAQSKFGGASAYFDGTGDYITSPANSDFAFAGEFTVEFWVRFNAISSGLGGLVTNTSTWTIYQYPTNYIQFGRPGTANDIQSSVTVTTNTWYHVAVTRNSSDLVTLWIDGVSRGTKTISGYFGDYASGEFRLARSHGGYDSNVWIDEVRVSNICRYTTGFTPSASAFTNDADTVLLVHCDGSDGSTTFTDDNS